MSHRSKNGGRRTNRRPRPLRVEPLEARALLTVTLNLPTDPIKANEGALLDFALPAKSDNPSMSYTLVERPTGATVDTQGVFHWTPSDGPQTAKVNVTVSDDDGSVSGSFSIQVLNVAPDAAISGPSTGVRGQPLTFQFKASDPSPVDSLSLKATVDWGDGTTPVEIQNAPPVTELQHVFAATSSPTASYAITLTVTDKDGGQSTAQHTVSITPAALQPDPLYGGTMLVVGGTSANDKIVLNPSRGVKVLINGQSQGSFAPTSRIVVYGQAGDDDIQVAGAVQLAAWLYGGEGNDRLKGGKGNDLLFGGLGNDDLLGGQGNDLLVGDIGSDRLNGESGDDLLIDGRLELARGDDALKDVMSEWGKTTKFESRVNAISGILVVGSTVLHDSDTDKLTGAAGTDWFFYQVGVDVATDLDMAKPKKPKK